MYIDDGKTEKKKIESFFATMFGRPKE